jgi:hypothetical protein
MEPAHFTLTGSGEFEPTKFAGSHWGDDHLNGPAVWAWRPEHSNSTTDHPISCRRG